jgi:hypothetical protein
VSFFRKIDDQLSDCAPPPSKIFSKVGSSLSHQRPILNFAPRGKIWPQGRIRPPGVNFVPWGWSYPQGVKFFVCPSILLNSRECSPLGVNKVVNIPPRGQITPLGAKVTPMEARGKLNNGLSKLVWSFKTAWEGYIIPYMKFYTRSQSYYRE